MNSIQRENKNFKSINDVNFNDSSQRMDSPRSLEACLRLGIDSNDLYKIDINKYKQSNPSLYALPKDLQELRYNNNDKFRERTITQVKEEREKIIKEQEDQKEKKSSHNSQTYDSVDKRMDSLIEAEKKSIEKIKNRQKIEIQTMIETQIRNDIIKKNTEEKERRQQEKEEEYTRALLEKQREQDEQRRQKEMKRQNELNKQIEEQKQRIAEKEEKERRRLKEINEQEEKKKEEKQKKNEEDEFKMTMHKSQLELFRQQQEEELRKKREQQEKRDKEIQHQKEKMRLERIVQSEKQKEIAEARLRNSRLLTETNIEHMRIQMENKSKKKDSKLEEYYRQREIALREQRKKNIEKKKKINSVLVQNEALEEEKKTQYVKRQEEIDQIVFMRELNRNEKMKTRSTQLHSSHIKTAENRTELSKEEENKKKLLLTRMDEIQRRINEKKKKEEMDIRCQQEEANSLQEEKAKLIERIKNAQEYRNKLRMNELEEKEKRLEEYKLQREQLAQSKTKIANEIEKQKKDVMEKFDNLIKKKRQVDGEIVKELFPEDKELYERLIKLKQNSQNETSTNTNNASNIKTKEPNMSEKEIEKKVEEFRSRLIGEIKQVINEEKIKEEKRIKVYEGTQDKDGKQKLEKENAKERAISNKKVTDMQNNLEIKVKKYEDKLRTEALLI